MYFNERRKQEIVLTDLSLEARVRLCEQDVKHCEIVMKNNVHCDAIKFTQTVVHLRAL